MTKRISNPPPPVKDKPPYGGNAPVQLGKIEAAEPYRLWLANPDQSMPHITDKHANAIEVFRKINLHDGQIEQYTETLARRWWQLKAATRIRIRRVQPQTFNCRCSMVNL